MMLRTTLAALLGALATGAAAAQTPGDACHVYVVDVEKARRALREYRDTGNPASDTKALDASQTVFPEFRPTVAEEELTTKTYPFPWGRLVITASVYYTDESMASAAGADSMLLAVAVSRRAQESAVSAEDNAVAEVTSHAHTDTVRAKKYVRHRGSLYLVGIECRREPGTPAGLP